MNDNKKDVKVLFIPTANSGVAFYRMWTWNTAAYRNRAFISHCPWFKFEQNETNAWEVDISDSRFYSRIMNELNDHIQKADVVVMQMVHTKAALNLFLCIKEAYPHIPVVVEQDDMMLSTPEYNPATPFYKQGSSFREVAIEQMKYADAMVVTTLYLKEVYSEFCDNIYVMPNSIDFEIWKKAMNVRLQKKRRGLRIGWAGGASHHEDLRIIEPVVHKTLEAHKEARFVLVHGIPPFFKNIPRIECVTHFKAIDQYPRFLGARGFDIGLAPLEDNAFNRGKSNLRWLEYSALGIPTVASNVGHFAQTIKQGQDGFLAKDEKEWIEYIDHLIKDAKFRREIGQAAWERVHMDFNVDKNVFFYRDAMQEIAARGQVKKIPEPEYYAPMNAAAGMEIDENVGVLPGTDIKATDISQYQGEGGLIQ